MVSRRNFLQVSACGIGVGLLPNVSAFAGTADSRIDVLLEEPVGTISPDLYGYLLENLGTVIYDGIWVGEKSKIPNVGGIRKAVIDRLRDITASVIRWPGGNFADYYDWIDGVGPRAKRPRRTNHWTDEMDPATPNGPQRFDPNLFGTPEFMRLCKLTGGRPFFGVNGRLPPQSFSRWVEYCNSPAGSTTLADVRKQDGSAEPYGARYWSIANEVWSWGGPMSAEEYASLYKRFTAHVPQYGVDLCLVAAGPAPGLSTDFIRDFLRICTSTIVPVPIHAISLHHYAALPLNEMKYRETMEDLLERDPASLGLLDGDHYGVDEWYQTLESASRLTGLIDSYWQAIGEFDPKRRIKLAVDEWGAIYQRKPRPDPANLTGRDVTLRDALGASLSLDIINNKCGMLSVANYNGLINQEGGIFQTDADKFLTTPVFHVFKMYSGHQGGTALRTLFDVPSIRAEEIKQANPLAQLSGSASLRGNRLTLTVSNPHASKSHDARINLRGAEAISATVATLTSKDIGARNSFENPENLVPTKSELNVNGSSFTYSFPAASITSFTLVLNGRSS
jgi:alpha-L-arabinofuranosidase